MSETNLVQSWNKRSKFWVLIDASKKGGIKEFSREKFEGVPVKKGKPDANITKDAKAQSPQSNGKQEQPTDTPAERKPEAETEPKPTQKDSEQSPIDSDTSNNFFW